MDMKRSAIYSAIIHGVILILLVFGGAPHFEKKAPDNNQVIIEFDRIAPQSAAPVISPIDAPVKDPLEKKVEEPKDAPKKQNDEKPKQSIPAPEETVQKQEPVEKLENKDRQKDAIALKKDKPIKKDKKEKKKSKKDTKKKTDKKVKKKPIKKKPKKTKKKQKPKKARLHVKKEKKTNKKKSKSKKKSKTSSLSDLLDGAAKDVKKTSGGGAKVNQVADVVTSSEIAAIQATIRKCWHIPAGAKGIKDMAVVLNLELDVDGHIVVAEPIDAKRMKQDPYFRTAAEAAMRAALDPECNPLPLSPEKIAELRKDTLELEFNPKDMF